MYGFPSRCSFTMGELNYLSYVYQLCPSQTEIYRDSCLSQDSTMISSLVSSRRLLCLCFFIAICRYKSLFYISMDVFFFFFHLQNAQSHSPLTKHSYFHTSHSRLCLCNTSYCINTPAVRHMKRARPSFRIYNIAISGNLSSAFDSRQERAD